MTIGSRQGFGVFVKTWEDEWQVTTAAISFAASMGWLVNGFSQPLLGRLADLYGGGPSAQKDNAELKHGILGYINSLSYNFNEEGTWHYMDEVNRVPKFITANIEFQVIHDQTANINTRFYGMEYNKQTINNQEGIMFDTYGKSYSDEAIPYSQPDDA